MRHSPESFLGNKLTSLPANAVSFVLYSYKCSLKVLNEFLLTLGKASCLLLG